MPTHSLDIVCLEKNLGHSITLADKLLERECVQVCVRERDCVCECERERERETDEDRGMQFFFKAKFFTHCNFFPLQGHEKPVVKKPTIAKNKVLKKVF